MSLLLGNPQGPEELEQAFAAIQTAFNQVAGFGKWIDVPWAPEILRNDGAGNSWTSTALSGDLNRVVSYMMFGNSMVFSFYISNTNLTVATAINGVYLRIPTGYKVVTTRSHVGKGWMINGGVALGAIVLNGGISATADYSNYVVVLKDSAANIANDPSFTIAGSILMEVTKA